MYQQKNYNSFVPWLMILLAGSFYCYEYILRISPSVMIPELMSSFSIQATQIGLLSSFYYFGYSMGSVLVGPFVDKYGPKKVLFWAAILCALGTLLFAHADSLALAKLSRLIIGLGSAFAFIGVLKIGAIWLPGDYFGRLAGMCSMLGTASGMLGQIFLSRLMNDYSWQSLSIYSAAVGGVIALLLFLLLQDKKNTSVANSIHAEKEVETFAQLFSTFKKVGRTKVFWQNCLIGFTTFLPIIAFADLWGIPFIQEVYHVDRETAALNVSMVFLGWSIGGPSFGYLFDVFKRWQPIFLLGTLVAVLCCAIILYNPMPIEWMRYVLFMFGFSASSHVLVFVSSKKMSPKEIEGTTLGVTNLFMMSAGVIVQPCIGSVIDYCIPVMQSFGIVLNTVQSYQCALSIIPVSLLITLYLINRVSSIIYSKDLKSFLPRNLQLSMLTRQSWPDSRYVENIEESPGSAGQSAR